MNSTKGGKRSIVHAYKGRALAANQSEKKGKLKVEGRKKTRGLEEGPAGKSLSLHERVSWLVGKWLKDKH